MVDQAVVLKKLGQLLAYVADVRRRLPDDAAVFAGDADLHDLIAHREAFESLAAAGLIDAGLAARVANTAALRNRLAHAYCSVDWLKLHAEAPAHLAALTGALA